MRQNSITFLLSFFLTLGLLAQTDSTALYKRRKKTLFLLQSTGYVGSMSGLYFLWYKPYRTTNFHYFNDNDEWHKVDKVGHALTAYQVGRYSYNWYKWANFNENKSIWLGGLTGFIYLTTVEVFDGFSDGWGFSYGDMLANIAGAFGFVAQQKYWKEQRIALKFSFHQTVYANQNPELLGENLLQQSLKDYNGQTYWLSLNIYSFFKESKFPKWLNMAFGYGAEGMVSATTPDSYKQYYFSLDIDLWRIKTKSKFVNSIFKSVGFIKIPAPAVELSRGKVHFRALYF